MDTIINPERAAESRNEHTQSNTAGGKLHKHSKDAELTGLERSSRLLNRCVEQRQDQDFGRPFWGRIRGDTGRENPGRNSAGQTVPWGNTRSKACGSRLKVSTGN